MATERLWDCFVIVSPRGAAVQAPKEIYFNVSGTHRDHALKNAKDLILGQDIDILEIEVWETTVRGKRILVVDEQWYLEKLLAKNERSDSGTSNRVGSHPDIR